MDWTVKEKAYLDGLAEDYGVDVTTVYALADMLGREELADGLINALEDASEYLY